MGNFLAYPLAPKECRTDESTRLTMGLAEIELDASTAARARKDPATSTDDPAIAYSTINPQRSYNDMFGRNGGGEVRGRWRKGTPIGKRVQPAIVRGEYRPARTGTTLAFSPHLPRVLNVS